MSEQPAAPETAADDGGGPSGEELRATLKRRTGPLAALMQGATLAGHTAGVGLPVALAFAAVSATLGWVCIDLGGRILTLEPASAELGMQVFGISALFLAIYGVIQFTKRKTASRASWWPVLLIIPSALVAGSFALTFGGQARQIGPLVPGLVQSAWYLTFASFGGAACAIAWVRSGVASLDGQPTSLGEVVSEIGSRTIEIAGPHGARVQAVSIGMQILVPGIFYMLQLAFADMVAVLEPERAALRRSGQLTWGMRGRLFRMVLPWFFLVQAAEIGLVVAVGGVGEEGVAGRIFSMMMDPAGISFPVLIGREVIWTLAGWWLTMSLVVLYRERLAQVHAKVALRKLAAADQAAE